MGQVSVVARGGESKDEISGVELSNRVGEQNVNTPMTVVQDTFAHATWGTILVGLTSLALPGVGVVLAAGSVGAALVASVAGMGAGAVAANNLTHTLKDLGIPQTAAETYSDRLLQGQDLVILEGSEAEIQGSQAVFQDCGIQDWGVYPAA